MHILWSLLSSSKSWAIGLRPLCPLIVKQVALSPFARSQLQAARFDWLRFRRVDRSCLRRQHHYDKNRPESKLSIDRSHVDKTWNCIYSSLCSLGKSWLVACPVLSSSIHCCSIPARYSPPKAKASSDLWQWWWLAQRPLSHLLISFQIKYFWRAWNPNLVDSDGISSPISCWDINFLHLWLLIQLAYSKVLILCCFTYFP